MEQITEWTKASCRGARKVLDKHLQNAAEELGMDIESLNGRFGDVALSMKIEFRLRNVNGKSADVSEWENFVKWTGLEAEDLGKKISLRSEQFTIVGCNPRKRKNSIRIKRIDGKTFVTDVQTTLTAIGRKG